MVRLNNKVAAIILSILLLAPICVLMKGQSPAQERIGVREAEPGRRPGLPAEPCTRAISRAPDGLVVWSADGKQYIVNKQDASGVYQLYVGAAGSDAVCISCIQQPNSPAPNRDKLQPSWLPSGQWIVLAGEMDDSQIPWYIPPSLVEGWVESGIWVNIYITRPDGSEWYQLSNFGNEQPADGFTGVAFTPDGTKAVWAQILNNTIPQYLFGRWQLMMADFQEANGVPSFANIQNITPAGANWIEPGNFAPDGKSLLFTSDIGMTDPEGMDQFILDTTTGAVRNLTNSPTIWDEHGVFSPDGKKILFMSSYPYRADPNSNKVLSLKTEFMLMNNDGTDLQQLTHFNVPGYPESDPPQQGSVAAVGAWSPDGNSITALNLFFPNYQTWSITFHGYCNTGRGIPPESF
jgi:Tol biopolymer transport system component